MGNQATTPSNQAAFAPHSGGRTQWDTKFHNVQHKQTAPNAGAPASDIKAMLPSDIKAMIEQTLGTEVKAIFNAQPTGQSTNKVTGSHSKGDCGPRQPRHVAHETSETNGSKGSSSKGKGKGMPVVNRGLCQEQLDALDEQSGVKGKGKGPGLRGPQGSYDSFITTACMDGSMAQRRPSSLSFQTDCGCPTTESFSAGVGLQSCQTRLPVGMQALKGCETRLPVGVSFPGTPAGLNTHPQVGLNTQSTASKPPYEGSTTMPPEGSTTRLPQGGRAPAKRAGSFVSMPTTAPEKFGPRMDMIRE